MHRLIKFSLLLNLLLGISICQGQENSEENEPIWTWFSTSVQAETLQLNVIFNGKSLLDTAFSVSKMSVREYRQQPTEHELKFSFDAQPSIFYDSGNGWPGSFDSEYAPNKVHHILGKIWEAGGDKTFIILGIYCETSEAELLNSIHIAEIDSEQSSDYWGGLTIETKPVHTEDIKHMKKR